MIGRDAFVGVSIPMTMSKYRNYQHERQEANELEVRPRCHLSNGNPKWAV
jgi:hypothetical protein